MRGYSYGSRVKVEGVVSVGSMFREIPRRRERLYVREVFPFNDVINPMVNRRGNPLCSQTSFAVSAVLCRKCNALVAGERRCTFRSLIVFLIIMYGYT